jgi:hypothetical protein
MFIESTAETEEMLELKKHLEGSPGQTTTMADLAYLLFLMGDFNRAIDFCKKLLHSVPGNLSLTIKCYNIMGQMHLNFNCNMIQMISIL